MDFDYLPKYDFIKIYKIYIKIKIANRTKKVISQKIIRKIIYTTNPIESLNSALRKVTRGKGQQKLLVIQNSIYK